MSRGDVRERIDRLEEVKDLIIGFLERAPVENPAMREMWKGDAKEAFFEVVAAYDLLPSADEKVRANDSNARAFLQMARGRVRQVSSELRTFRTDVADDLDSQLHEAFDRAYEAISKLVGSPPPALDRAWPAVELIGEDHYALRCGSCGQVAAAFSVEVPKLSATGGQAILFQGVTKSTHFDMSNERAIFGRLEEVDLRGLHAFIERTAVGGLDALCPSCGKVYCREHWDLEEEWDEGFYDCTYGTCPEGHRRLLDD